MDLRLRPEVRGVSRRGARLPGGELAAARRRGRSPRRTARERSSANARSRAATCTDTSRAPTAARSSRRTRSRTAILRPGVRGRGRHARRPRHRSGDARADAARLRQRRAARALHPADAARRHRAGVRGTASRARAATWRRSRAAPCSTATPGVINGHKIWTSDAVAGRLHVRTVPHRARRAEARGHLVPADRHERSPASRCVRCAR